MSRREVPQPSVERMVPFAGHPVVVGVMPGQPELVVLTALQWARAAGGLELHLAYADPGRFVVDEQPDGSVRHAALDPDGADDAWQRTRSELHDHLGAVLAGADPDGEVAWRLHYLAGRPDRALTHLARALDAALIVVGTRNPGRGHTLHKLLEGSVARHLTHHQHRPVLTVPLSVVDWAEGPDA
ncbi:universal stress protein [Luteimicrobium subarcticum]|uniref:Nucleotide-binding universal stress UspA family protein n=1 Tax=Luteimicrobium subarcticum TaxID=620910 RepID=A0A2M8W1K9_9MICO|nr:universal stress protein [Luteimicrobium subarcticum]PJI84813.1 nucleotide-binding universal stress UspA family protein [Luteimicrobium subarcticum]